MDRKIEKKFWTTQRIVLFVLGAAFVGFFGWQLLKDHKTTLNVEQDKLTISEVMNGTFDETIPITGNVQPLKTIRLDAGMVTKTYQLTSGTYIWDVSNNKGEAILKKSIVH